MSRKPLRRQGIMDNLYSEKIIGKRFRDIWPYIFFAASVLLMVVFLTKSRYFYGSTTDWDVQHTVIPDHMRQMFYDTGVLFPQFDPNMGAGQNMYYLAYYGFMSPVMMFSYLLPMVSMKTYIEWSSVISVIASICLVYRWLRSKAGFMSALFAALMFEFAVPLTFHSHRHVMFIVYMPFLMLAFMGADRFLRGRSPLLLMTGIVLMIFTSFYFSVGGLISLAFYMLVEYVRMRESRGLDVGSADMIKKAAGAALALVIAVMTSAILLLPELAAIKGNRIENNVSYTWADLLLPDPTVAGPFYGTSTMGLTAAFAAAVILCILSGKRWERMLGVFLAVISCENIFVYLLNGKIYLDGKVLIPFLPLAALALESFAVKLREEEFNFPLLAVISAALCVFIFLRADGEETWIRLMFAVDMAFTVLMAAAARYGRRAEGPLTAFVLTAALVCFSSNAEENLVSRTGRMESDLLTEEYLSGCAQNMDGSLYRTGNLYYPYDSVNRVMNSGYLSTTDYLSVSSSKYAAFSSDALYADEPSRNSMIKRQTGGLLMNLFMGNKYMIAMDQPCAGYEQTAERNGVSLWKNDAAYPLAYVTHSTMSTADYLKLDRPDRAAAMMTSAISDRVHTSSDIPRAKEVKTSGFYDFLDSSGKLIPAKKLASGWYELDLMSDRKEYVKLDKKQKNKVLLVSLKVDNGSLAEVKDLLPGEGPADMKITVNGITNTLTAPISRYYNGNERFEFAVSSDDPIKSLGVTFSEGNYKISDFKVYALDINDIISARESLDGFVQVSDSGGKAVYPADPAEGVILDGKVDAKGDGYFVATIPYDDNFTFYVDGKKTDFFLTDGAFMGFPLSSGEHDIKAVYHNSAADKGAALSAAGLALMISWSVVHMVRAKRKMKDSGVNENDQ